jgi:hypothetical protein
MAIWHAGNIVSNVFSGLLAAAILTNMDNIVPQLHAWQWFILIEGWSWKPFFKTPSLC